MSPASAYTPILAVSSYGENQKPFFLLSNVREIQNYGGGSLMVWAGIINLNSNRESGSAIYCSFHHNIQGVSKLLGKTLRDDSTHQDKQ
ncbi:hypothetical protein TNCV_13131 [Trichonephila clavipes]|nr:hypothetical protein TNCV_13131 [Trichonephila clavipes]